MTAPAFQTSDAAAAQPDWDEIVAHVCASTGWSWDEVEETLTVPRLLALTRYWRNHPPAHMLLAAWLGVKPKRYEDPALLIGLASAGK